MRRVQVKSLASSMRPGIRYISGQKENCCHVTTVEEITFKVGSVFTVTGFLLISDYIWRIIKNLMYKCGEVYADFAGEALFTITVFVNLCKFLDMLVFVMLKHFFKF